MLLRVTKYGEAILRKKGERVERFDRKLARLAEDMVETMYAYEGIGLAAQQVNQSIMLCVLDLQLAGKEFEIEYSIDGKQPPLELLMPLVLINPEVETTSNMEAPYKEGCLSFPEIRAEVYRLNTISVVYQDQEGVSHKLECGGLLARVIQHEVDHLNGILFIDRMEPLVLKSIEPEIKKLKRQTREYSKDPRGKPRGI